MFVAGGIFARFKLIMEPRLILNLRDSEGRNELKPEDYCFEMKLMFITAFKLFSFPFVNVFIVEKKNIVFKFPGSTPFVRLVKEFIPSAKN